MVLEYSMCEITGGRQSASFDGWKKTSDINAFESWEERSRLVNQYGETIHGSGMNPIRRYRRREDTLGIDTIPAVVFFAIMI